MIRREQPAQPASKRSTTLRRRRSENRKSRSMRRPSTSPRPTFRSDAFTPFSLEERGVMRRTESQPRRQSWRWASRSRASARRIRTRHEDRSRRDSAHWRNRTPRSRNGDPTHSRRRQSPTNPAAAERFSNRHAAQVIASRSGVGRRIQPAVQIVRSCHIRQEYRLAPP